MPCLDPYPRHIVLPHAIRATVALTLAICCVVACAATNSAPASAPGASSPRDVDTAHARRAQDATRSAVDDIRFEYFGGLTFDADVPTPADAFGYAIGEHFPRQHEIVAYLRALADASDRVQVAQYGVSHQGRPLHALTISSPNNIARLDDILAANRELADRTLADDRRDAIVDSNPAIVWFSYTVHGNEASTASAAVQVAYTLAAATNDDVADILDDVVVVIDPLLNPDGYMRYVNWYDTLVGTSPDANPVAAEHNEPWPGGRSNHYMFDLNRDWLWGVHPESRSRVAIYRDYLPHLHIDFHEQGYTNPYFLGAGDTPYNVNIPEETKQWIERYGDANAAVFDRHNLMYSSKERFDYMYAGYGKVLPVYHGAVGMLAEQAGHGRAGLAIDVDDEYTLTLSERARNHFLLSMSNIETTAAHRREQLERFRRFFAEACDPAAHDVWAYIVSSDNDPAAMQRLWTLCRAHGVEIERTANAANVPGLRDYRYGETADEMRVPAGSWVIRPAQPMGRLVNMLFERSTEITDPDTYDITSWPVPVMFGLNAWEATQPLAVDLEPAASHDIPDGEITGDGAVALIVASDQYRFPELLGRIGELELTARIAGEDFRLEARDFPRGSLIVHPTRNRDAQMEAAEAAVLDLGLRAHRAGTGMTETGPVLGANTNDFFTAPKILLLRDSPVSSLSFGQLWHLFDVDTPMPHTVVNVGDVRRVNLDDFTVLVVPHGGGLDGALGSGTVDDIRAWVRGGGTIVAVGGGAAWASRSILDLSGSGAREDDDDDAQDDDDDADEDEEDDRPTNELSWAERRDRGIERRIPGATLRATFDMTHPLTAGLPREWTAALKRDRRTLPVGDNGYVVARFDEQPHIAGAISDDNAARIGTTAMITHHRFGRGNVICFSDDPTVRGFMHGPTRVLLNCVVFGPNL